MPIPHQIPPPPRDFTGREDDIKELLGQFGQGATITGLRGMGGVGKTALALLLAERLAGRCPDGQILVEMKGTDKKPLSWAEAMIQVIHAYDPEYKMPLNEGELPGKYFSMLHGRKALLLLDNAANREHVEPLLPPKGCVLLITSRQKFALPDLKEKDLKFLHLEDAKSLLLKVCERIGDHAEELAKLCGCLPIALRNAAYALKEKPNLCLEGYIKRLGDAKKRLELVDASFSTSYELLAPELQKQWSLLSVFPSDFDLDGAAAVWEMERISAEDELGELTNWSLVDFLPDTAGESGRYKLHGLARDFAESRLEDVSRESARFRHARHYQELLSLTNELFLKGNGSMLMGLKLFDINWMDIEAGQEWASENKSKSNEIAEICSYYSRAWFILDLRLHPRKYIGWLEEALVAVRKIKNKEAEGAHLNNIGIAFKDLGEPRKAIEYYDKALNIAREIGNHRAEGYCLGNLGLAYYLMGELHKAIEYHELALKIAREIGDRKGEGNCLNNIGIAYKDLGEPRKAIEYHEMALKIAREIGDRKGEGNRLGNIGIAYKDLGDPRKAIEYCEQGLRIAREIGDRRGEGNHLGNIGVAYKNLSEPYKAFDYSEQALKISREVGDRRAEANHLFNLSLSLDKLGQNGKAIDLAKSALVIFEQIESPHAETVRKKLAEWSA